MNIKNQIRLSVILSLILAAVISGSIVVSYQTIQELQHQEDLAADVVRGGYELAYISNDYLTNAAPRARIQWEERYTSLQPIISQIKPGTEEEAQSLESIRDCNAKMGILFREIPEPGALSAGAVQFPPDYSQVMWSRNNVQSQGMIYEAWRLRHLYNHDVNEARFWNNVLVFVLMVLMLVIIGVNYLLISRRLVRSIRKVNIGSEVFATGNLDYRIPVPDKDEIGEIADRLNAMAGQLSNVTASRDELNHEIKERKLAEDALRVSEIRFRTMADWTGDWEYWIAPNLKFEYLSPSVDQITGYLPEEFIADPDLINRIVHPDDRLVWDSHILLHFSTAETGNSELEFRIIHKDGSVRWISHLCRTIILDDGSCIGRRVSNRDITNRKLMESEIRSLNTALEQRVEQRTAQLTTSLEDKVILLREVHHRVKNNLQIIISLLNLQSRYIEDEKTQQVIRESQNRVKAMALVHEKLYQSTDIAKIDLDSYIRYLGNSLFQFYGMTGKGIVFNTRIQDINVDLNTTIPVGLIVNELISNSLKHAFPDGRKGEISIVIQRQNALLTIEYKDNGIGIPQDFDWRNAESLGLRLVIMLVEQQDGTIELDLSSGTAFTIVVKEKE